ncbi:MAG: ComEC family competence protein [Pelotomaculum sp. PtaB.Bin013]|nr:MAG: ComEC family competence protein [Pelotomaculum sp. PtaB.Bin013]
MARPLAQALAVPLAAQLATIPLVAWYYNLISPVSILANLVVVPLTGIIMFLGFISAVLGMIWLPLAALVNVSNGVIIDVFLKSVSFFQGLPGAVFYLPTPPEVLAAAWYGGLMAIGWLYSGRCEPAVKERVKGWVIVGLALCAALFLVWVPWAGGHGLTVHFLDVGQGDCILVQTPGGNNMLIDTGGRRDEYQTGTGVGDQVVTPYLRKIGVRRLDVLVLTHPHEDHAGGAATIVKNFPVRMAVVPQMDEVVLKSQEGLVAGETTAVKKKGKNDTGEEVPLAYIALLKKMAAGGIAVRAAGAGDVIKLDRETEVEVLYPGLAAGKTISNMNNCSLVLKLTYRQKSFMFTGDVETDAQSGLIQTGADLKADILKMPHHGSRSLLPALVEQVNPEAAVISVGAHNNFGHPAQSTLETLNRDGVRVYRTDQDGAVIFNTDGRRLEVKTGKNKDTT